MKFLRLVLALMVGSGTSMMAGGDLSKGFLLVANKGEHTLGIIDPVAGKQIATVDEEGVTGHELVASADGKRAFVPIYGNSGVGKPGTDGTLIRVIDLAGRKIIGTINLGKGLRPHCAVLGPKDGLLYVTTEIDNCITVIDPNTLKVVHTVPTGAPESHMLAISSDGKKGYTANVGPGTVSVLDLKKRAVLTSIKISGSTQRIAISPDDRWVFTADQTKPQLAVIETASNTVRHWIPLPGLGYGTAPTPDGRWLVVAVPPANKVAIIDLTKMEVAQSLDVPKAPQEVLVRPDGSEAYVSCDSSRKVAVIDLKAQKVSGFIDAGAGVDGLAWARTE
jgi:YVTN family beta-propeller protein